jgi:transposase
MNKETVSLSKREQRRVMVLNKVERGEMTGVAAAVMLGLSVRQVRRLLAAYRQEGVAAVAHGNRGRQPSHTIPASARQAVLDLAQERYRGANHTHLSELLAEREGISLSRSTVRRILSSAGLRSPRKRRAPKHRQRRARYSQEGMLVQVDGSRHDWLEGRGPWLTLVGGIDDATGTVPYACFREQEDAHGYFLLLRGIIQRKGLPLAIYSDRHSIFMVSAQTRLKQRFYDPSQVPNYEQYTRQLTPEEQMVEHSNREMASRLCWRPYLHDLSLPYYLRKVPTPALIVWGQQDAIFQWSALSCTRKPCPMPRSKLLTIAVIPQLSKSLGSSYRQSGSSFLASLNHSRPSLILQQENHHPLPDLERSRACH